MADCRKCGKTGFGILEMKGGECPACRKAEATRRASKSAEQIEDEKRQRDHLLAASEGLLITTEANVPDTKARLGVVATEVVLGMNLFKDVLANIRDVFGGRSGAVQNTLSDARAIAFTEIRVQAAELGADAVVAVDIDYHSISTGSSVNMMIVSVSGTAVKLVGQPGS